MWGKKPKSQPEPPKPQPKSSQIPNHSVEAYDLCTTKCLQFGLSNQPSIVQKSCFHRCIIKYTQSLKFTMDYVKYQNYELKKSHEQHLRQKQGMDQQGFLDKLHNIYNQHYGNTAKAENDTTA